MPIPRGDGRYAAKARFRMILWILLGLGILTVAAVGVAIYFIVKCDWSLPMAKTWFVRDRGAGMGPLSEEQLLDMRDRGQIQSYHEVSTDKRNWGPVRHRVSNGSGTDAVASKNGAARPIRGSRPAPVAAGRGNRTYMLVIGGVVAVLLVCAAVVVGIMVVKRGNSDNEAPGYRKARSRLSRTRNSRTRSRRGRRRRVGRSRHLHQIQRRLLVRTPIRARKRFRRYLRRTHHHQPPRR